jgi:lysophospholipase L1-like esterase
MADQIIDKRTVGLVGPRGDVTPAALAAQDGAEAARDAAEEHERKAETFAAQTHDNLDAAVTGLITETDSSTARLLNMGRGSHAVFIGDSITQGYRSSANAKRWSSLLCASFGWVEHNYAVGGTGFVNAGPSSNARFDQQVATAAADESYDPLLVTHVFLIGGVNDGAPTPENQAAGLSVATDCVTGLRSAFPNARIITGFGVSGMLDPTAHGLGNTPLIDRLAYYRALEDTVGLLDVTLVSELWKWVYYDETLQSDDYVHPNDAGYARIAMLMRQVVLGTYSRSRMMMKRVSAWGLKFGPTVGVQHLGLRLEGDQVHISGDITTSVPEGDTAVSQGTFAPLLCTFPAFFRVKSGVLFRTVSQIRGSAWLGNAYLQIGGDASTGIATLKGNANIPGAPWYAVGDKVVFYVNITLPAYGLGK